MKVPVRTKAEMEAIKRIDADLAAGKIDQKQHKFLMLWLQETVRASYDILKHRKEHPEIPHKLTLSPSGCECLGNGKWVGYACQCPDCDYYQVCFPDWEGRKII